MKRCVKGYAFIIGITFLFAYIFISNDSRGFLFAQESNVPSTYTADAVPSDTKEITISFNEEKDRAIENLKITINGEDFLYNTSDYNDGVLTLKVSNTDASLIDFSDSTYYFEPSYIIVNENGSDEVSDFNVNAYVGREKDLIEVKTYDDKEQDEFVFENDETAYISLAATKPMTAIFYQLPTDNKIYTYDKPIILNALSEREHSIKINIFGIRYYPGEEPPTFDSTSDQDFIGQATVFYNESCP